VRIAIVGGALQGMEAVYLSKKAGFETFVIDKRKDAPALSVSDDHAVLNPATNRKEAMRIFEGCDAVLPACEDMGLLCALQELFSVSDIPLLFDMDSYMVSSSKSASNRIMEGAGIPIPRKWPECGYPAILKPSSQSGSIGVTVAYSENDVSDGLKKIAGIGDEPVIQEFVSGKSVSVEVIGNGREFRSFATTEILLSKDYDCKRVRCTPDILTDEREEEFRHIAERIAESIGLKSLMDVEAIDTENGLKVLEIDARIPSQTPAAVLAATGMNILKEMVIPDRRAYENMDSRVSSYEHFVINNGTMMTCGEKEFSHVRRPRIVSGMFGSDDMITDYEPGKKIWRCTMINSADTEDELERKRSRCIAAIMNECNVNEFVDPSPDVIQ
jgi:pyrrolysine biosynthesis protein PylC